MLIRVNRPVRVALCLVVGSIAALAQTNYAYVTASYPMNGVTLSGAKFSVMLGVTYPTNLSASSYVSGTQLATDVAGFFAGYPSQSDAPEAIGSSVLTSLLGKYSQMSGGILSLSVSPTVSPTGQVSLGATIEVVMGTIASGGIILGQNPPQSTRIVKPLIRPAPQDSKAGN